ncbi:hypothetical protein CC79DRAFT_1328188 [Sarocladium strictum]
MWFVLEGHAANLLPCPRTVLYGGSDYIKTLNESTALFVLASMIERDIKFVFARYNIPVHSCDSWYTAIKPRHPAAALINESTRPTVGGIRRSNIIQRSLNPQNRYHRVSSPSYSKSQSLPLP